MTHWLHTLHVALRPRRKNSIIAVLAVMAFLFGIVVRSYASETLRLFHPGSLMGRVDMQGFQLTLLGILTLVDLGLVGAGIYGVMSFSVTHRTPEIGRQIACGAKTSKVLKLVLWHGMKLALLGAVQGLAVAFLLAGWIKALLLGVSATDPLTFLVVTLLLGVVAFAVYYLLTRRAAKEEPIALRYE